MCYVLQRRAGPRLCSPRFGIWGCCTLAICNSPSAHGRYQRHFAQPLSRCLQSSLIKRLQDKLIFVKFSRMGRDHTTIKAVTNLAFEPIKDTNLHTSVKTVLHRVFCYLSFIRGVWSCTKRDYWDCEGLKYLHLLTRAIMCSYYSQTSNCITSPLEGKLLSIKHKNYPLILKANTACMETSITGFKSQEALKRPLGGL